MIFFAVSIRCSSWSFERQAAGTSPDAERRQRADDERVAAPADEVELAPDADRHRAHRGGGVAVRPARDPAALRQRGVARTDAAAVDVLTREVTQVLLRITRALHEGDVAVVPRVTHRHETRVQRVVVVRHERARVVERQRAVGVPQRHRAAAVVVALQRVRDDHVGRVRPAVEVDEHDALLSDRRAAGDGNHPAHRTERRDARGGSRELDDVAPRESAGHVPESRPRRRLGGPGRGGHGFGCAGAAGVRRMSVAHVLTPLSAGG